MKKEVQNKKRRDTYIKPLLKRHVLLKKSKDAVFRTAYTCIGAFQAD